jgi:circadian clock protein KaiC
MARKRPARREPASLEKCPTGVSGLDDIAQGGLPRGRPTLICGGAGCGKTLLAMEFVIRGITQFDEPGVFMAFEETEEDLAKNVASLGFDVRDLVDRGQLAIDYVHIEPREIVDAGEYDLEGLFVRLNAAIESVGAKRVVLDTIESLFAGLTNEGILRAELRRLLRWLKDKGVTTVITGEKGENMLTRHGLEEYVSDCVIFLDHRVVNQIATRRLRIVKYRGSEHGTNEYPVLIDKGGFSVLPVSSLGLSYSVSNKRISSGIERLDAMLGGQGYYRGSSVLISGTAGTGKTSLAVAFVDGLCRAGRKCMYFAFEESPDQIIRNMRSIGYDLEQWVRDGRLALHSLRPTMYGLEMHLARMHKLVQDFAPEGIVMDPITNLTSLGNTAEIKAMLTRVIDYLKTSGITAVFTSLTTASGSLEETEVGISSLMDTWLLVRMQESNGERNRLLHVLKSRGMAHSNQTREFLLSSKGIGLVDVYVGTGAVLTGSARLLQEAADQAEQAVAAETSARRQRELQNEKTALRAQAQSIEERLAGIAAELKRNKSDDEQRQEDRRKQRRQLAATRKAD